jgi:simple sugar transport system permease protein
MMLSGALGGIGGAMYVLMILGKFQTGVPAYGFDGITVSILAGNNPLGVGFAALLFGVLKSGTTVVQFATDVPPQLVGVLRGLIILFVAMPEFFRLVGRRFLDVGGSGPEAVATDGGRAGGGSDE